MEENSGNKPTCKIGISSCICGAISGLGLLALFIFSGIYGLLDNTPNLIIINLSGIFFVIFICFTLLGIIAAIYSIMDNGKPKAYPYVGIVLNGMVLLVCIVVLFFGLS